MLSDFVLESLREHNAGDGWDTKSDDFWFRLTPATYSWRPAGWKLHLSTTPLSAVTTLRHTLPILLDEQCAFKITKGFAELEHVLSGRVDRTSGGKFMTVYPRDDEQFSRLAERLDDATTGLNGPPIITDRRFRPGSLVHYRYGPFRAPVVLNDEDFLEPMLVAPDGSLEPDVRVPWFATPSWAPAPPLPHATESTPGEPAGSGEPLLHGRYAVHVALRHSYRGGVYRATDTRTNTSVIIKQARPHVVAVRTGQDAQQRVRNEAKMLDRLAPLDVAPRTVETFEIDGNLFLVRDDVVGKISRLWFDAQSHDSTDGIVPAAEAKKLIRNIVDAVGKIHEQGIVLRDLNPNNIIVLPGDDYRIRVIDLEYAADDGVLSERVATPGFAAPEQCRRDEPDASPAGVVAHQTADMFSLGTTILYLVTGAEPVLARDDSPESRSAAGRLEEFVRALSVNDPTVRWLAPLLVGLTQEDPSDRWSLKDVTEFLSHHEPSSGSRGSVLDGEARIGDDERDALLNDGVSYLLNAMTPEGPHLWPAVTDGNRISDPCNVASGAAGVLAVLTRIGTTADGRDLSETISETAHWIERKLAGWPRVLPGLYFGHGGTAWALYDAGVALGDEQLIERALDIAKRLPVDWHNPDVMHGVAGAGMAYLHLWQATKDDELADRVRQCAATIMRLLVSSQGQLPWPAANKPAPNLSGLHAYGFAHGVAGVATFLLSARDLLDEPCYWENVLSAGETLLTVAERTQQAAWWRSGTADDDGTGLTSWCNGAAGVGMLLVRLWRATGDQRYLDHARLAAVSMRRERWFYSPIFCHGVSGQGEFLLDLADATGDRRYRHWAAELAASIYVRRAVRDTSLVVPSGDLMTVTTGFVGGLAGVLGFMHRLRCGGPSWWMPDDPKNRQVGSQVEE